MQRGTRGISVDGRPSIKAIRVPHSTNVRGCGRNAAASNCGREHGGTGPWDIPLTLTPYPAAVTVEKFATFTGPSEFPKRDSEIAEMVLGISIVSFSESN